MASPAWRMALLPGRIIGRPGSEYRSCCLRSQSLRGAAPGASMSHVRVTRVARSDSVSRATPFSVHETFVNRNAVLANSAGAPAKVAASDMTLSRAGTVFLGSPSSSASTHSNVAGTVGFQRCDRGPVTTPPIGTPSASGCSPSVRTRSPLRLQISRSFANPFAVTRRENGRLMRETSTNCPSGDIEASAKIAGLPIGTLAPAGVTVASWEVK